MQLKSVDFPAPLGPISAVIDAGSDRERRVDDGADAGERLAHALRASSSALIRAPSPRDAREDPAGAK